MRPHDLAALLALRRLHEEACERCLRVAQQALRVRQEEAVRVQRRWERYQQWAERHRRRLQLRLGVTPLPQERLLRWREVEGQLACRALGFAEELRVAQAAVASAMEDVDGARSAWRKARGARMKMAELVAQAKRRRALQGATREMALVEERTQRRGLDEVVWWG